MKDKERPTLADLGISKRESAEAQVLATVVMLPIYPAPARKDEHGAGEEVLLHLIIGSLKEKTRRLEDPYRACRKQRRGPVPWAC